MPLGEWTLQLRQTLGAGSPSPSSKSNLGGALHSHCSPCLVPSRYLTSYQLGKQLLQDFGGPLFSGEERKKQVSWVNCSHCHNLLAATDTHPLLSSSLHSSLPSPSAGMYGAASGWPGGMTNSITPEQPKPLGHCVHLRPRLWQASVFHQNWARGYNSAPPVDCLAARRAPLSSVVYQPC